MPFCPMMANSYMALPGYGSINHATSCPMLMRMKDAESNLEDTFRMLWEQHVVWTRLTILSIIFGLPDENLVTNRLLRNPEDMGAVLKRFYGDKIATMFTELLKSHLVIAAQLVKAAKAGNSAAANDAEKRWYANADEIASFLAGINPYWSEEKWRDMLYTHLKLTKSEAVNILNKNYSEGISIFDEIEKQALGMADVMASGIASQFYH